MTTIKVKNGTAQVIKDGKVIYTCTFSLDYHAKRDAQNWCKQKGIEYK